MRNGLESNVDTLQKIIPAAIGTFAAVREYSATISVMLARYGVLQLAETGQSHLFPGGRFSPEASSTCCAARSPSSF
jgi:hypothetical protein